MAKLHRTALGKSIDMNALRAKNEHVRAVGNMSVNARGDILDSHDKIINDNNRRISAMYQKTMTEGGTRPVSVNAVVPDTQPLQPQTVNSEVSEVPGFDPEFNEPNPKKSEVTKTSKKS